MLAYCDWVRWKVWSATSISVWQHVQLPEQVHLHVAGMLSKQATNKLCFCLPTLALLTNTLLAVLGEWNCVLHLSHLPGLIGWATCACQGCCICSHSVYLMESRGALWLSACFSFPYVLEFRPPALSICLFSLFKFYILKLVAGFLVLLFLFCFFSGYSGFLPSFVG